MWRKSCCHVPNMSPEAKVRDHRTANDGSSELYCDDDMSLKERLARAEAVSKGPLAGIIICDIT